MDGSSAVSKQELMEVLSGSPFARIYDFRIESAASGECTLVIPFQKALERPGGMVSGSALITAADVAMWLAIMTRLGSSAMAVTTEMKTTFLNSAREEDVWCTSRVLKLGKTLIYGVAECKSSGALLAHHTLTYARLDK